MKKQITVEKFLSPFFRRLLRHKFDERFTWGSVNLHPKHWRVALEFHQPDIFYQPTLQLGLIWLTIYLYLPHWMGAKKTDSGCAGGNQWGPDYGIYTIDTSVVFRWGNRVYKSWDLPFVSYNHQSTEVLDENRACVFTENHGDHKSYEEWRAIADSVSRVYDYTYTLRSGEIQRRKATVFIERRTWGRKWAPFLKLVSTTLDIRFDGEVGEGTGSWKGGVLGTGHKMLPDESPLECLRRFERTEKFPR